MYWIQLKFFQGKLIYSHSDILIPILFSISELSRLYQIVVDHCYFYLIYLTSHMHTTCH
jgi:hypothetical protein